MSHPTLILGAGLAGLSCARHLGKGYRIAEATDVPGGAARSFQRGDFTFDITGHWLHLIDDGIRALVEGLLENQLMRVQRRASVFSHGVFTPYPFQANTHGLPPEVIADCVLGYFQARERDLRGETPEPESFEDFIRQRMGDGIAEHFMLPYNAKLWTVPPKEMSHAWTGRFVPIPKPEEVVRGALIPAGAGHALGYNSSFLYPKSGGIGTLAAALATSLPDPVEYGRRAVRIDWQKRSAHFSDASDIAYDTLVSTLPLKSLIALLVEPPEAVRQAADQLRATTVTYWDLGFAGANAGQDFHWLYVPEPDFPFYRVGSASAAVPYVAPEGHRSYYVEVAHSQGTTCNVSDQEILDGLRAARIVGMQEEPVLSQKSSVDCAYVIMDHNYGAARSLLLDWLQEQNILSIGRYGAWTYDSMEGAMVKGREAAQQIAKLRH